MSHYSTLGALATYVATSIFFWYNPHLIHKKKKISFKAFHISHRGGSGEGYENTLKNFKKAVDGGTQMLELDVQLTKDRQVVVCHDSNLQRLAGEMIKISDVNYDDLPILQSNLAVDTLPGVFLHDSTWTNDERKIPLLREVFKQFTNVPMNIDLKDNELDLISEVSNLIGEYDRESITVWGSFNNQVCKRCYKENPNINLFFSAWRVISLLLLAITGLLPFIPIKENYFEVFLPRYLVKRRLSQVSSLNRREKVLLWICESMLLSKTIIRHLKKRGIQIYFWVCNDTDDYLKCLDLGADGIMTDYPTRLHSFVRSHQSEIQKATDQHSSNIQT